MTERLKRAYSVVAAAAHGGSWAVELDGSPARTPAGAELLLPTRPLAEAAAREWSDQSEFLDPNLMPITRLANSAIDGVARDPEAVRRDLMNYARSDLVCYRAGEPERLVAAQREVWDPILDWARESLGARFILSEGVVFVPQPAQALAAVEAAVARYPSPLALTALHVMTSLTGSVLIALAVASGRLSAQAGWRAAHVDEDEQARVWGEDAEAVRRRARRWRDMDAAGRVIALLRRG